MVADISYDNHIVATVTQENGIDKMLIEIFPPEEEEKSWKFLLDDFIESIAFAKKHLIGKDKKSE